MDVGISVLCKGKTVPILEGRVRLPGGGGTEAENRANPVQPCVVVGKVAEAEAWSLRSTVQGYPQ